MNTKEFQEINSKLKDISNKLKKVQLKAYNYKPEMRFIYGREINLIYDILKNKDKNKTKIIPFFKFLSNNLIKKQIEEIKKILKNPLILDKVKIRKKQYIKAYF